MKRKLNLQLLAILVAATAICGVGVHFLHAYQIRQSGTTLLREANRTHQEAEDASRAADPEREAKKRVEEVGFLGRYVRLAPNDNAARAQLGLEQAKLGYYREAYFNLDEALRRDSTLTDARREFAKIALGLRRFSKSVEHADELLKAFPKDFELQQLKSRCHVGLKQYSKACDSYETTIKVAPLNELSPYVELAYLLREKTPELQSTTTPPKLLEKTTPVAKADAVIEEMVSKNSKQADAYLERGNFRLRYGVSDGAPNQSMSETTSISGERKRTLDAIAADAKEALKLEPDNFKALLLASRVEQQLGNLEEARRFAETCRTKHSDSVEGHLQLASVEASSGNLADAVDALKHGDETVENFINRSQQRIDAFQHDTSAEEKTADLVKEIKELRPKVEDRRRKLVELRWNFVNLSLDNHDLKTAEAELSLIRTAEIPKPRIDFLDAHILVEKQSWSEAVGELNKVRPLIAEWPELAKQVDFWLGNTYRALGDSDQQLASYRKVVAVDPFAVSARAGVADALTALGRTDEAFEEYRSIVALPQREQSVLIPIAQQIVLATLRQNKELRDWTLAEKAVDAAAKGDSGSGAVTALRAEILVGQSQGAENLVAQKKIAEAETLLETARKEKPDELPIWTTQIALAQRIEKLDRSRELIDAAIAKFGDRPELRLSRARMFAIPGMKKDAAQLRELATLPESYSKAEKILLAGSLAPIMVALREPDLAKELCKFVADEEPSNLQIRLFQFDLAVRQDQMDEMNGLLNGISKIEGDGPLSKYCSAVIDFVLARKGGEEKFKTALASLKEVQKMRPSWSRVPVLIGEIAFQRGNIGEATTAYLSAVELGERSEQAIGRTLELLNKQRRYVEAGKVERQYLEQSGPISEVLERMSAEISLGLNDYDRALDQTEQATSKYSRPEDFIRHARVLSINKRFEEAEKNLRRAIELGPKVAEARVLLIQLLVTTKRLDDAAAELKIAEREIDGKDAPLAIAQCYEFLGNKVEAEKRYESALASSADDRMNEPLVVRGVADFYLRSGQGPKAEQQLNRITSRGLKVDNDTLRMSRHNHAMLLAVRGDIDSFKRADSLIADNLKEFGNLIDDRRLKAILYSTRSSVAEKRIAIDLLEEIVRGGQQSKPEDRFMLASLYVADGKLPQAREQLVTLVRAQSEKPQYMAALVRVLLSNREAAEAARWLDRLEKLAPGTLPVVELRVATLFALRRYDELVKTLNDALKSGKPEELDVIRQWAGPQFNVYARQFRALKDQNRAQELARTGESVYDALIAQKPDRQLLKVGFLVGQERLDDALSQFEQHWKEAPPQLLGQALLDLQSGCLTSVPHQERFYSLLVPVVEAKADSPFRSVLADLSMWMGKYDEAIAHYRQILKRDATNQVALNNLAILLAVVKQQHAEAQSLIDTLLSVAGTQSVFLDSQAMLYLAADQPDRALQTLISAEKDSPSADVKFHLASAYLKLGRTVEARTAFEECIKLELKEEKLQRFEREEFRNLKAKLN